MSAGQYSSDGAGAGAVAPGAREDLVGHQHRHVAAQPVALVADADQRLGHRLAQRGRVGVELDDVGPWGEVRVAALRERRRRRCQERLRMPREFLLGAAQETLGALSRPRVVGRDVVGHEVEDQPELAVGERGAGPGQGLGAAEAIVDHVVAHAVRRADHVLVAKVGQGARDRPRRAGDRRGRSQAGRAALPDAHQPHGVDGQRGERVPLGCGHLVERSARPRSRPRRSQPDRGVDLVDRSGAAGSRIGSGGGCGRARTRRQQEQQRHGAGPAGLVAGADAGAVVAVEVLVEQQQVAPVGIGLELLGPAEHGAAPVRVARERARQAPPISPATSLQVHLAARAGRALDVSRSP